MIYLNTELKHSASKKHKYIMKIGSGPKARYIYTQQELEAYRKIGKTVKNEIAGIKRFASAMSGKSKNNKVVFYSGNGKTYATAKVNKKTRIASDFSKEHNTAKIERGLLWINRKLHPDW